MSSAIERFLYGSYGTHALLSITLAEQRIAVTLAPWSELTVCTEVVFTAVQLQSIQTTRADADEEADLPWDIIAFDSDELADGRWCFMLYAGGLLAVRMASHEAH